MRGYFGTGVEWPGKPANAGVRFHPAPASLEWTDARAVSM